MMPGTGPCAEVLDVVQWALICLNGFQAIVVAYIAQKQKRAERQRLRQYDMVRSLVDEYLKDRNATNGETVRRGGRKA